MVTTETTVDKLARWNNTLNGWEWPDDLVGKPKDWDRLLWFYKELDHIPFVTKYWWIGQINPIIVDIIGDKECLRWHHLHNLGHSNDYFEVWWCTRQVGLAHEFYNVINEQTVTPKVGRSMNAKIKRFLLWIGNHSIGWTYTWFAGWKR